MGGSSDPRPAPNRGRRRDDGASSDPCDFDLEIDLVGLQPSTAASLRSGDLLIVDLAPMPPAVSVVCRTSAGDVVGALSAFLGLTQMIACLRKGVDYRAMVISASSTRCTVVVRQAGMF